MKWSGSRTDVRALRVCNEHWQRQTAALRDPKGGTELPHTFLGGGSCVCPKSISRIAFVAVVNVNLFDRSRCVRFHSIDRNAIFARRTSSASGDWKRQSPLKMGVEPERSRYFCLRCEAMIEMHCMGDSFVWMRDEFHASLDEVHGRIEVVTGLRKSIQ